MSISIISNHKKRPGVFSTGVLLLWIASVFSLASCSDYLDVVPDNVTTIEHAFALKNEAEKYLFTCYSYIPKNGDGWYNIGMMAGDEIWLPQTNQTYWNPANRIAQSQQSSNRPLLDAWRGNELGAAGGWSKRLFAGIRSCNIFLENVSDRSRVPDLELDVRVRWLGEAEFLKAYYHYYLLRMYGPIPIIDTNVSIDADVQASYVTRKPIDECVNYISALLDSAAARLPDVVPNELQEMGRATKPMALALKAKLWMMAASPLFNGNTDFAGFTDHEGVALFPGYDAAKWVKARDACKAAIDAAEAEGAVLHEYTQDPFGLEPVTKIQVGIREAVTKPWNREVVWANSNSYFWNSNMCQVLLTGTKAQNRLPTPGVWEAPIKIVKMFYTKNGVPLEEDKTLDFSDYEQLRKAVKTEGYNIKTGYTSARLNFDRENRFYADLGFDGGIWYKFDAREVDTAYYAQTKWADLGGAPSTLSWNETGYYIKKLVNLDMVFNDNDGTSYGQYPWPEIRLADLYLLYAESLNEVEPASVEAIDYVDRIRERAGLAGVVDSWTNYSSNPSKYSSQDGLREIIHRERLIELAFEGQRFWDLRRWKKAAEELNKDITGWNYTGTTAATYYKETYIYSQTFVTPRDYFWPIGVEDTRKNPKLVENPGW